MTKNRNTVVFILARGGSKRLPGKNLMQLGDKPLIQYAIDLAVSCDLVKDVVVSTDCSDITRFVEKYGQCRLIKRPDDLAQDNTTSEETLRHAVEFYKEKINKDFDNLVLLQPTSPFTKTNTLEDVIAKLATYQSVLTVVPAIKKFEWYGKIDERGVFVNFLSEEQKREYTGTPQYIPSGNAYGVRLNFFLATGKLKSEEDTGVVIVEGKEAIDIDYQSDFDYAIFAQSRS